MAELATSQGYKTVVQAGNQTVWGTVVPATVRFDVIEETFRQEIASKIVPGADGQKSQRANRRRLGVASANGGFKTGVFADQTNKILEMAFGNVVSAGAFNFPVGDGILYTFEIDKAGVTTVGQMNSIDNRVNRAVFSSSQDQQDLTATYEFLGSAMSGSIAVTPGISSPTGVVLQHYELVLTINGTAYFPRSVEVTIDHALVDDVYRTSRGRLAIPAGRRVVKGVFELDWSDTTKALYSSFLNDTDFGFDLTWTNGTNSLTLKTHTPASAGAKFDGETPTGDPQNFTLPLRLPFTCYSDDPISDPDGVKDLTGVAA